MMLWLAGRGPLLPRGGRGEAGGCRLLKLQNQRSSPVLLQDVLSRPGRVG